MRRTLLLSCFLLAACRGQYSDKPPIHPNPNMMDQEKYDPQEANPFFPDGRANRPLVEGVVSREDRGSDPVLLHGKNPDGSFVLDNPMPITMALLQRGQERFQIFCSPCHDRSGYGKGMVIRIPIEKSYLGFPPPTNYHDPRVRNMPDGQIFDAISNCVRTMPSYAIQVAPEDRWAIIAYIRALERSQDASLADVPAEQLNNPAFANVSSPDKKP